MRRQPAAEEFERLEDRQFRDRLILRFRAGEEINDFHALISGPEESLLRNQDEANRLIIIINQSGLSVKTQWFDFFERGLEEFGRVDEEERFDIRLALMQGVTFMQQASLDLDAVMDGMEGGEVPLNRPQLLQAVAAFENRFQNQH